ncbi:Hypothetical protein, putative [Bodo saltans]|uniref:Uncharacterized protein n=1 Tax=Bodo saltans TaxID=75058 RepID=A0A0S4JTL9_BODSA|nr:Hypothetical protein, putative [Bodo saltans]|eukprot:CUG93581.1 Hypothetical protein, putative [Bodo saltans]
MPRRTPYDSSPTDAVDGRVVLASMQSHLDPETEYGYPPIVEFLPLLNPLSPHDHDGFVAVGDVAMQCHFPQPQIRFGGGGQRSSTPETRPTNQSIHSELLQTQRHSHSPYGHPVLARLTTEDETRQQQQHTPEDAQQSPHTLKRRQSGGHETFSMNTSITRTPYQTYKQFNSQPSDEVHSAFLLGGPTTSHGNNNGSNTPLLTGISTPQQYRRGAGRATPNGQHQPYGDLQCTPVQHSTPQHIRLQYPRPSSVTHESGDPYMPGVTVHYEKPPSSPAIYIKDLQHHQAQHLTHRSPPTVNLGFSPIARTVGQQQGGTPQTQARKPSAAGAAAAGSHTPSHGSRPPTGKSMKRAASALSMLSAAAIETTAAILDPNTPLQLHQELRFSPSSMLPGQSPGNPFAQQLLPPPAAASPTPLLLLECEDDRCTSPTLYADRVHRFMSIALQIPQLALRSHQKLDPQSTDLEDLRLQFGEATAADAADNDDAENDQDEGGDSDLETGGVSPNNATAAQQPELLTAEEFFFWR